MAKAAKSPLAPVRPEPTPAIEFFDIWEGVRRALTALPAYFKTETVIAGLRATDIFTLGATLGATIEDQVVATLNSMRTVWDPDAQYPLFRFSRQPQTFPDVLLASRTADQSKIDRIALGIELKGWYLLAKEGEPSFRYTVTPQVCTPLDLIAVVPWYLSNVISGSPKVLEPYIESARYAAEYRNYFWQHARVTKGNSAIRSPADATPYPAKSDKISDHPADDAGGNFGRIARTNLMDDYVQVVNHEPISGIEARYWLQFFKMFNERDDPKKIAAAFKRIQTQLKKDQPTIDTSGIGPALLDAIYREFGMD